MLSLGLSSMVKVLTALSHKLWGVLLSVIFIALTLIQITDSGYVGVSVSMYLDYRGWYNVQMNTGPFGTKFGDIFWFHFFNNIENSVLKY